MSKPTTPASRQVSELLKLAWNLADSRATQVGYLALLFTAQCISLCQPLVIGDMLNAVQTGGADLWPKLWPMLPLLFALEVGFWGFPFPPPGLHPEPAFRIRGKF